MTEQTEFFQGSSLTVDGITSRYGILRQNDGDFGTQVGVGHVNRIFETKDDHPQAACWACAPSNPIWGEAMRWTKERPILRFTSNGLEVSYHGGQVPG